MPGPVAQSSVLPQLNALPGNDRQNSCTDLLTNANSVKDTVKKAEEEQSGFTAWLTWGGREVVAGVGILTVGLMAGAGREFYVFVRIKK